MSETVISVENLYKEYKLGVISQGTLYHDMQSWWARIRGKEDPNSIISEHHSSKAEEGSFLALNDVSFEVKEGEILGIIGKNGAGKSTLLKILSRITAPTKGQIRIKGRVGSLLEVGTGFHPELTGQENIYLNGAILGMRKWEINKKLDEIIDFAGIERHIDTPVKRYSSGMYVRLAFSVAAHLDPEILVVDEVLAVGDADFQKKCLGKMKDISEGQGRTVLFVSHNMASVEKLCERGIILNKGSLQFQSSHIIEVISKYLNYEGNRNEAVTIWENESDEYNNPYFKPLSFWISREDGKVLRNPVTNDSEIYVNIFFNVVEKNIGLEAGVRIYTEKGQLVLISHFTDEDERNWPNIDYGKNTIRTQIPRRFLSEQLYRIELVSSLYRKKWLLEPAKSNINIFLNISGGASDSPYWSPRRSAISPILKWTRCE